MRGYGLCDTGNVYHENVVAISGSRTGTAAGGAGGTTLAEAIVHGHWLFVFCRAEDGIRDYRVTGVQTCALLVVTRLNSSHTISRRRHTDYRVTGVQTCGSEERRVGKEGRSRWSPYHYKKKK